MAGRRLRRDRNGIRPFSMAGSAAGLDVRLGIER